MSEANVKIVQGAYTAFGRQDMPALLDALADDVDWQGVVGAGPEIPMRGNRRGKQGVTEFFRQVGEHTEFGRFEPQEFLAANDKVVVLGYYDGRSRKTGRLFQTEWVMVFTVRNGKIVRFREFLDAENVNAAFTA